MRLVGLVSGTPEFQSDFRAHLYRRVGGEMPDYLLLIKVLFVKFG
jgi:hypothetical protein